MIALDSLLEELVESAKAGNLFYTIIPSYISKLLNATLTSYNEYLYILYKLADILRAEPYLFKIQVGVHMEQLYLKISWHKDISLLPRTTPHLRKYHANS